MLFPFEAGVRDWRAGRIVEARAAFQRAADSGDPRGWFALGQLASEGHGEPENPAKAAQLYRRAADAGSSTAAHSLAALHALGRGVPHDAAKALEWYRHGADLGDPEAACNAGNGSITAVTIPAGQSSVQMYAKLASLPAPGIFYSAAPGLVGALLKP